MRGARFVGRAFQARLANPKGSRHSLLAGLVVIAVMTLTGVIRHPPHH